MWGKAGPPVRKFEVTIAVVPADWTYRAQRSPFFCAEGVLMVFPLTIMLVEPR